MLYSYIKTNIINMKGIKTYLRYR